MDATPIRWADRAAAVGAAPADAAAGTAALAALWAGGRGSFDVASMRQLAAWLQFARVGEGRRLIAQDEHGDFMLIVVEGTVAVRHGAARLADARPGDVLGEMALLDAGPRASDCTTRTDCVVAVLEDNQLTRLMADDPPLALALLAAVARRLSLRLRQLSVRLSALLAGA